MNILLRLLDEVLADISDLGWEVRISKRGQLYHVKVVDEATGEFIGSGRYKTLAEAIENLKSLT